MLTDGRQIGPREKLADVLHADRSVGRSWPVAANEEAFQPAPQAPSISARELGILQSLAQGHSIKEIARAHFLSEHTVKYHIKNIYLKLGVHRRIAAILQATRLGLLPRT